MFKIICCCTISVWRLQQLQIALLSFIYLTYHELVFLSFIFFSFSLSRQHQEHGTTELWQTAALQNHGDCLRLWSEEGDGKRSGSHWRQTSVQAWLARSVDTTNQTLLPQLSLLPYSLSHSAVYPDQFFHEQLIFWYWHC